MAKIVEKKTGTVTKKRAPKTVAAPTVRPQLTHERVAKRAFEIWCGKGMPSGTEHENWIQAEQELFDEVQAAHTDA